MMIMVAYLFWILVLSFIVGKWSDCDWEVRMMLMVSHFSWTLILSFIGSK